MYSGEGWALGSPFRFIGKWNTKTWTPRNVAQLYNNNVGFSKHHVNTDNQNNLCLHPRSSLQLPVNPKYPYCSQ